MMNRTRPRIVIVGAGFGGLWTAQQLADADADVFVIDRNNYHSFLPLLYQVAAAEIEPGQIAYPVRAILRKLSNVNFVMDEVFSIDVQQQTVVLSSEEMHYDYLVLALGSRAHFFGVDGAAEHAYPLKTMSHALALRNQILRCFEQASHEPDAEKRRQLLTFAIVGGGPTGVEYAGALTELIRKPLARDYPTIDLDEAQVLLIEGAAQLLGAMPDKLGNYTARRLAKMGVELHLNTFVTGVSADTVQLSDGVAIPANTVVWTAGVQGETLAGQWSLPMGPGGRVRVLPSLQVDGLERVYAIGDMMYLEQDGEPLPMLAPVATQQGKFTAQNIMHQMRGEPVEAFRYADRGSMATIGRNAAVAVIASRAFTGYFAWLIWLIIHLANLIGFRNRLIVLISWAWNYLFYERAARFIFEQQSRYPQGEP
jgi:NADH dehydrogenase